MAPADALTPYAMDFRYPSEMPELKRGDAEEALAMAVMVLPT